jgi:hypothetical protein
MANSIVLENQLPGNPDTVGLFSATLPLN